MPVNKAALTHLPFVLFINSPFKFVLINIIKKYTKQALQYKHTQILLLFLILNKT